MEGFHNHTYPSLDQTATISEKGEVYRLVTIKNVKCYNFLNVGSKKSHGNMRTTVSKQ